MAIPVFKVKLTILKGSTFSQLVTWSTGETAETATPVDLTGCKARMQIRPDIESSTVLEEFTTEDGGIELGGTAGTIRFAILNATETAAIDWDGGVYDLEIIFSDGVTVLRKIKGAVVISPEVTRD
jgi:hypothetical protein